MRVLTWQITATNADSGLTVEVKVRGTPAREEIARLLLEKAASRNPFLAVRGASAEDMLRRHGFEVTKAEVLDEAKHGSGTGSRRRRTA